MDYAKVEDTESATETMRFITGAPDRSSMPDVTDIKCNINNTLFSVLPGARH
jgi:hypothetical protein